MRIPLLAVFMLAAPLASLGAQIDPAKVPRRPQLPADRDTNSAGAYFYPSVPSVPPCGPHG
jgi:hypothetical protein